MLTTIVAFGNILTNKLRKEGNMQKQWARIDGSPQQLKKTRRYLEDRVSTFVLSNKKTQYVEVPRVELKWLSDVIKNCNAQWRKVEDPGHFLALCGQWTTSVVKHQIACRQCRAVKSTNTDSEQNASPKPLPDFTVTIKGATASQKEKLPNKYFENKSTENTLSVLQNLVKTAAEHKDEYLGLASKWERYQNALEEVCNEIVTSAHRLKEAKAEYEASANRIAKLLDVENV
jgi:hypothetical protein